jgi:hypothetical protein
MPLLASTSNRPMTWYTVSSPETVGVWPELSAPGVEMMHFYAALAPSQFATTLPALAASLFYDAILDGFKARVYAHPRKPYTDKDAAMAARTSFLAAAGRATGQAKQGFANAQVWSFPRFGR